MATPIPIHKRRRSHGVEKSLSDAFLVLYLFLPLLEFLYIQLLHVYLLNLFKNSQRLTVLPLEISHRGLSGTLSILANNMIAGTAQMTSMYLQTCPVFAIVTPRIALKTYAKIARQQSLVHFGLPYALSFHAVPFLLKGRHHRRGSSNSQPQ